MSDWDDGQWDLNVVLADAAATFELGVGVQEVLISDDVRMSGWGEIGELEHLLW